MKGVSVIIPVYTAEAFVEKAVESALLQEEVGEVLLIEDGSSDGSLASCERLASLYEKVRLFRHPGGINRGAGASRNLGLMKAEYDFVSFLDADDYFLPYRFVSPLKVFKENPEVDGVYGRAGYHYYSQEAKFKHQAMYGVREHVGIYGQVPPELLFHTFLTKPGEGFILGSCLFKSSFLEKVGKFDVDLKQTQDTDWLLRCCLKGVLIADKSGKSLLNIGIHANNRVLKESEAQQYRYILLNKWFKKLMVLDQPRNTYIYLLRSLLDCHESVSKHHKNKRHRQLSKLKVIIFSFLKHPILANRFLHKFL